MDSSEQKKNKDNVVHFFRGFFEIKRPEKQQPATLPRMKNTPRDQDDNKMDKERLFTRHHSYRRSARTTKYKKEAKTNPKEKYAIETESTVKRICQKIEENIINAEPNVDKPFNKCTQDPVDKKTVSNLNNTEVKKRLYDKNRRQLRETKIKSFVEAENEGETEDYRRSLVNEIDTEIAQMKEDGFIDDEENIIPQDALLEKNIVDIETKLNVSGNYLENMDEVMYNKLLSSQDVINDDTQLDHETIIVIQDGEEQNHVDTTQNEKHIKTYSDDFTESLSDDLENGYFVVEAYNDDGRELIEIQVMIDRRTVSLDKKSIEKVVEESDMVFYQEDQTLNLLQNTDSENLIDDITPCPSTSGLQDPIDTEENIYEDIDILNPHGPLLVIAPLSNRSTIYSTTSQESSVNEDDDEGIELVKNKENEEELYSNVRRETFCDNQGIVRIERVAFSNDLPFPSDNTSASVSRSNSVASLKRLEFIVDEIKSTEKKYVADLAKVVKLYKPYIERHTEQHLRDYQGYLFGNLEKLYRRQRRFLRDIENADGDVDNIVKCFINHELLFEMYPHYFRNKAKADKLLKEFAGIIKGMQDTFQERLDLSSYLLTPVQRLGKYILFLENIEKQLTKLELPTDNVKAALAIVRDEMSKGNDSVAIESIENSPISKMDYGPFKMREKFNIIKPRKVEVMVFLFHNVLVFSTCDTTKLEIFYYYDSIKMIDLRIATFDDFTIHLTDFTKSKKKRNSSKYTYVLESKTEKIWKVWKEAIEKMLWDQLVKEKENLLGLEKLKKYGTGERKRIKSTGSSVFYCEH